MKTSGWWLAGALAAVLTLTGCGDSAPPAAEFHATDVTGASFARDFALADHNGQPRRLADFRGKVVVVFFGYTHCPDVCPTTLSDFAAALKLLGEDAKRVQVLFVTVDPARDTPALLKQFVPSFHPSFLGLSGDEAATRALAGEFKVVYQKATGAGGDDYSVDHSTGSFVFDPAGRIRLLVSYGSTPEAITGDLRQLLAPN
jgi:protein SCO1/2